MITADPQERGARLHALSQILMRTATPEDRELLLAFAPVVYAEMPDRIALGLPATGSPSTPPSSRPTRWTRRSSSRA